MYNIIINLKIDKISYWVYVYGLMIYNYCEKFFNFESFFSDLKVVSLQITWFFFVIFTTQP